MRHATALVTVALLAAAARGAPGDDLAAQAQAILRTHCQRCHGQDGTAKGGFGFVLDRERLVSRGKVVPGKPAESELFQRVAAGEMPPEKQTPRPGTDEIAVLRRWIEAGAQAAGPPAGPRAFVADAEVTRLILADLQTIEPRQRRFVRYLTLTHLYNAGVADADLEAARHAVAKLVNSLSWHPRITNPQPIDPARTILRIDLRHYQWSARLWERLPLLYPYRTAADGPEAKALVTATGSELPHVRGDWFVATVSRPPLYHDFLQLPANDRELERLLRVDVLTNLQDENVARAGFNGSGVSRNNRLLERHDAAFGAYWRSYDFSDNTERQNLFDHPLGPLPGQNSFLHAGGELIFNLPNGLQGYLLVDGAGRRLDKAPVEIVSDPRRPDRTVENGLSCMSCHVRGILAKADQVRAHVKKNPTAFSAADAASVRALYPPEAAMKALMQEDTDRFVKALAKTGVRPDDAEPVSALALRYEGELDLAAAAAEAGLPADEFVRQLRGSLALGRVLGPLLVKGGTVQRSAFQAAFLDVTREFRPGTGEVARAVPLPPNFVPFSGHTGTVTCIAFAADGLRAASGSADCTVRLWDVATAKELQRFTGHTEEVLAVAVSPDGRRVVSGGRDQTVRLWDAASGKELFRLRGHTDRVSAVAISPAGLRVLSGAWDGSVRLWDAETGEEVHRLTGHADKIGAVAFSPDGHRALSAGHDGTLRLWDLGEGRELRRFEGHVREVYAVAFSPDGRRAASGGNDRTVRLWDVKTGKELRRCEGHDGAVVAVAFAPDGRQILSGASLYRGSDRPLRVWDADSGKELRALGGGGSVWSIAFAPDGRRALSGTSEKTLRVWQLSE